MVVLVLVLIGKNNRINNSFIDKLYSIEIKVLEKWRKAYYAIDN